MIKTKKKPETATKLLLKILRKRLVEILIFIAFILLLVVIFI